VSEQNPTPSDPSGQPQPEQPTAQQPTAQQPFGQPYQQPYGHQYSHQYSPQYSPQPYAPSRPTNSMAVVSLIAGIAGLTIFFFVGSIVAVITGPMARKQIAQTGEEGGGMATAGIIMGWIGIGLGAVGIIIWIVAMVFFAAAIGTSYTY
jgi:hypothetical protein